MDFSSVLKKIKTRGYCKVELYPYSKQEVVPSLPECKELVKNASVSFRGWDCPHIPTQNDERQALYSTDGRAEAFIDWQMHKEVWRYYQNGQFIFVFAQSLDWGEDFQSIFGGNNPFEGLKPGEKLGVIETVYKITEIFLFLADLAEKANYKTKLNIRISFYGMKNRVLHVDENRRAPLFYAYTCYSDKVEIKPIEISIPDLKEQKLQLAIESVKYIFEQFQWENPPISVFEEDQKKLIERRIF